MMTQNLDLSTRSGLPDAVAHLRGGYPRAAWRFHPNYGSLTTFWLNVHATLRREATALAEQLRAAQADPAAPFDARYAPALNGFLGHLDMHHGIEDAQFFPRFRRADQRAMAAIDVLEADHQLIEERLEALASSARTLLATATGTGDARRRALDTHAAEVHRFTRLLDRHLADEEEIVVPAMLVHGERVLS